MGGPGSGRISLDLAAIKRQAIHRAWHRINQELADEDSEQPERSKEQRQLRKDIVLKDLGRSQSLEVDASISIVDASGAIADLRAEAGSADEGQD